MVGNIRMLFDQSLDFFCAVVNLGGLLLCWLVRSRPLGPELGNKLPSPPAVQVRVAGQQVFDDL